MVPQTTINGDPSSMDPVINTRNPLQHYSSSNLFMKAAPSSLPPVSSPLSLPTHHASSSSYSKTDKSDDDKYHQQISLTTVWELYDVDLDLSLSYVIFPALLLTLLSVDTIFLITLGLGTLFTIICALTHQPALFIMSVWVTFALSSASLVLSDSLSLSSSLLAFTLLSSVIMLLAMCALWVTLHSSFVKTHIPVLPTVERVLFAVTPYPCVVIYLAACVVWGHVAYTHWYAVFSLMYVFYHLCLCPISGVEPTRLVHNSTIACIHTLSLLWLPPVTLIAIHGLRVFSSHFSSLLLCVCVPSLFIALSSHTLSSPLLWWLPVVTPAELALISRPLICACAFGMMLGLQFAVGHPILDALLPLSRTWPALNVLLVFVSWCLPFIALTLVTVPTTLLTPLSLSHRVWPVLLCTVASVTAAIALSVPLLLVPVFPFAVIILALFIRTKSSLMLAAFTSAAFLAVRWLLSRCVLFLTHLDIPHIDIYTFTWLLSGLALLPLILVGLLMLRDDSESLDAQDNTQSFSVMSSLLCAYAALLCLTEFILYSMNPHSPTPIYPSYLVLATSVAGYLGVGMLHQTNYASRLHSTLSRFRRRTLFSIQQQQHRPLVGLMCVAGVRTVMVGKLAILVTDDLHDLLHCLILAALVAPLLTVYPKRDTAHGTKAVVDMTTMLVHVGALFTALCVARSSLILHLLTALRITPTLSDTWGCVLVLTALVVVVFAHCWMGPRVGLRRVSLGLLLLAVLFLCARPPLSMICSLGTDVRCVDVAGVTQCSAHTSPSPVLAFFCQTNAHTPLELEFTHIQSWPAFAASGLQWLSLGLGIVSLIAVMSLPHPTPYVLPSLGIALGVFLVASLTPSMFGESPRSLCLVGVFVLACVKATETVHAVIMSHYTHLQQSYIFLHILFPCLLIGELFSTQRDIVLLGFGLYSFVNLLIAAAVKYKSTKPLPVVLIGNCACLLSLALSLCIHVFLLGHSELVVFGLSPILLLLNQDDTFLFKHITPPRRFLAPVLAVTLTLVGGTLWRLLAPLILSQLFIPTRLPVASVWILTKNLLLLLFTLPGVITIICLFLYQFTMDVDLVLVCLFVLLNIPALWFTNLHIVQGLSCLSILSSVYSYVSAIQPNK